MKTFRDGLYLYGWYMKKTLRAPVWALIGLFQPLCYAFLFMPLLNSVSGTPGFPPGGATNVFLPGLMVMLAIYGGAYVGFDLLAETRAGIVERLNATPVSPWALVGGRVAKDATVMLVQLGLLVAIMIPFGLRASVTGVLLVCALLALVGICLAACSYGLALAVRDENGLSSTLNTFSLPLVLLSGVFLPLTLAPPLLRAISSANPLAHVVDAARALLTRGPAAAGPSAWVFGLMALLAALALFWAANMLEAKRR